ncbi:fatty acid desaturase, type 1, core [Artemisia annua]|uniref:Fatty acid desaturase, type 1, core n=1 Tax=Artemisia annua TaxID=35608 RepID=A0A2U1L7Q5_ARTAN|nr:fatty acid desaturase, type 1, core [Artemisia annua]
MRNLIKVPIVAHESQYGKIPLSDLMVMRKCNLIMGRKWRTLDVKMAVGMLAIHVLALFAPFTFTWGAFWAAFWSYALCGICGVTLSYHRNLAHHSLKLPKWLEYTFAYLGVLAIQYQERKNVEDLKSQVFYRFVKTTYLLHIVAFAAIVYAIGGLFTYLVWVVVD